MGIESALHSFKIWMCMFVKWNNEFFWLKIKLLNFSLAYHIHQLPTLSPITFKSRLQNKLILKDYFFSPISLSPKLYFNTRIHQYQVTLTYIFKKIYYTTLWFSKSAQKTTTCVCYEHCIGLPCYRQARISLPSPSYCFNIRTKDFYQGPKASWQCAWTKGQFLGMFLSVIMYLSLFSLRWHFLCILILRNVILFGHSVIKGSSSLL